MFGQDAELCVDASRGASRTTSIVSGKTALFIADAVIPREKPGEDLGECDASEGLYRRNNVFRYFFEELNQ